MRKRCDDFDENAMTANKIYPSVFWVPLLVGILIFAFLTGCKQSNPNWAEAPDFKKAYELVKAGKYNEGYPLMLEAAKGGNRHAQYNLGVMLRQGLGVEADLKSAVTWYETAYQNGDGLAGLALAQIYSNGALGELRCNDAEKILHRLIQTKKARYFISMGRYYDFGICVDKDTSMANHYYSLAHATGDVSGVYLGSMYFRGDGVIQDVEKGVELLIKHCEEDLALCGYDLGGAYARGLGVQVDKEKAFEFFLMSARDGHAPSAYNVGISYIFGKGIAVDTARGLEWLKKSAAENHIRSLLLLGRLYEKGIDGEVNLQLARSYYGKAAALGNEKAVELLKAIDDSVLQ